MVPVLKAKPSYTHPIFDLKRSAKDSKVMFVYHTKLNAMGPIAKIVEDTGVLYSVFVNPTGNQMNRLEGRHTTFTNAINTVQSYYHL